MIKKAAPNTYKTLEPVFMDLEPVFTAKRDVFLPNLARLLR